MRRRLRIGLVIAFVLPLVVLSAYFYHQFSVTLAESGKLQLTALAESQRSTVDLFLQERVVNLFSLYRRPDLTRAPSQQQMDRYLEHLRGITGAFVDLGFFDTGGIQVGYAGPHPDLRDRDYSGEAWLQTLLAAQRSYYVSDIYLGFRHKPHFTIAVNQPTDSAPFVIRATLDPDKLYAFLETISHEKGVDCSIVSRSGQYQVVDPARGQPLGASDLVPPEAPPSGALEIAADGDVTLVGYAWLRETPWALVARQQQSIAYAEMFRVRRIILLGMAVLVVVVLAITWTTTDRLLARAQTTEESRDRLQVQLLHAAKLATAGELAGGVAHEINNPLAVILAESGLVRDMLDPQFGLDASPERIREHLDNIDAVVARAKTITGELLRFVRREEPKRVPCQVNQLLEDVLGGVKAKQFEVANIEIVRDFDPAIPVAMLDPYQLRQVFLNILNNAGDAINGSGTITLRTRRDGRHIRVTIADTGCGMTAEQLGRVFIPFFTTKETGKGTGLGLSISLRIVELMGGWIDVESAPGAGSSFTVVIPFEPAETASDG